jgi:hypothetical protein
MACTLYLVRHAMTAWNAERRWQGRRGWCHCIPNSSMPLLRTLEFGMSSFAAVEIPALWTARRWPAHNALDNPRTGCPHSRNPNCWFSIKDYDGEARRRTRRTFTHRSTGHRRFLFFHVLFAVAAPLGLHPTGPSTGAERWSSSVAEDLEFIDPPVSNLCAKNVVQTVVEGPPYLAPGHRAERVLVRARPTRALRVVSGG